MLPKNPLLRAPTRPPPKRVSIVGAGTIGPDIGYWLKSAMPAVELCMVDVQQRSLDAARARLQAYLDKGIARKKVTPEQAAAVADIRWTLETADIAGSDWVIEAATEDLPLKRRIFASIEEHLSAEAVITSNTSSIPASRLFSEMKHPGRATVTHFFAPAYKNPAVEVIAWEQGAAEVTDWLCWLFAANGKVPLVTRDVICFMLDRIFDNWCNDAALLLDRATAAEIDAVAEEFVHAGPFFVLNLARGNPIITETNTLQTEEGEAYRPATIFRSVDTWKTKVPGAPLAIEPERRAELRDRLLGVLLSQTFDVVDRDIGASADLALGCKLALGFKRDPFEVLADAGATADHVMARYAADRPGMPAPQRRLGAYLDFGRHVLVDDLDGVKVLTVRRPQAMNALDDAITDELLDALRAHEKDPAVAGFVITGYGNKAFCAGADIGRFPEVLGNAEAAAAYARGTSRLLLHLDAMEKPVVAALNGFALGGGLELALRCRSLVATRAAWLQFPEITLGIAPGIGGMVVPYRRWPAAADVFHDMLRFATRLDAGKALELGVLDGLADDVPALLAMATRRVRALAAEPNHVTTGPVAIPTFVRVAEPRAGKLVLSREVVGIIEAAVQEGACAATLGEALEASYRAFGRSACTAAAHEGVGAFLARRPADFTKTG